MKALSLDTQISNIQIFKYSNILDSSLSENLAFLYTLLVLKKRFVSIALAMLVLLIATAGIVFVSQRRNSEAWRGVRDHIMPQFMPMSAADRTVLTWKEFIPDVDIGVVVEQGEHYTFVKAAQLEEWDIDENTLYEQALRNLDARSRNIKVEVAQAADDNPSAKYIIVELNDGFASVRILSDGVRKAIARELGDEYIAAIPTRDFLIFWHKDFPLFDAFAKQVQTEFAEETEYALTPRLLRINQEGIQEVMRMKEVPSS